MNLPIFPTPIGRRPALTEPAASGLPLLRLGFRPFYLAAAAYAAIAVPVWVAVLLGALPWPGAVPPLLWHGHEMIYGFAVAVIVGFLLTAGKAWTSLATPRGPALAALVLLWLAARLAAVVAPPAVFALLDLALLPAVAAVLARVLWRAGNRRNLPLVALLLALAVVNAVFHGAVLGLGGLDAVDPRQPLHAALALVVMIECVMAGRVIPGFTMSATPGLKLPTPRHLGTAALAFTGAGLAGWVVAPQAAATVVLLGAAAVLQAVLLWHWRPARALHRPILWVLHAAYAWIPLGLALLALGGAGWVAGSAGIHALAVGATGVLIIGMITRTARGHTGRPLQVSRWEVAAYGLVIAAAALRVGLPLLGLPVVGHVAAAVAWSAAFVVYLSIYGPWLMQPRVDGRDG